MTSDAYSHFGTVAIVGKPNAGKSTLFNRLLGASVSVVTRKAQTTQSRVIGVVHDKPYQYVMFDTPGVKTRIKHRHLGHLNRVAKQSTYEADCALFLVSGQSWNEDDEEALGLLEDFKGPVIGVVNKMDHLSDQASINRVVDHLREKRDFHQIITISARHGTHVDVLKHELRSLIPKAYALYSEDQMTTHTEAFLCTEILRAKILEHCHEEIPYVSVVTLDLFEHQPKWLAMHAVIWVKSASQKPVIIGKQGALLKRIGMAAREQMQKLLKTKVVLKTWVKVGDPELEDLSGEVDF